MSPMTLLRFNRQFARQHTMDDEGSDVFLPFLLKLNVFRLRPFPSSKNPERYRVWNLL